MGELLPIALARTALGEVRMISGMINRSYDRSCLIYDSADHLLAQTALSLIALGHRPFYADDVDEMVLLAREHRDQVGALLVPAARASDGWVRLRTRIVEALGIAPCAVLPVGARLSESDTAALHGHGHGLRWALWEPFSSKELRFAVSMVLSETDPNELRLETRVPCAITVEVSSQGRLVPGRLTDLSSGGAFVQLDRPHPEGTQVVLRGILGGRLVSLPARVAWRTGPHPPSWREPGIGIEFARIGLETLGLLRRQVNRALDRFRLDAAAIAEQSLRTSAKANGAMRGS